MQNVQHSLAEQPTPTRLTTHPPPPACCLQGTVLVSLLQPTPETYDCFDDVMVRCCWDPSFSPMLSYPARPSAAPLLKPTAAKVPLKTNSRLPHLLSVRSPCS